MVYLFIHFCPNNENLQIWEDLSVLMIVFYMDQYGYIKRYAKWLDRVLRVNNDVDGVTVPDTFIACMLLCTMTTNWLIDWFILMQSMRFNNSLITLSFYLTEITLMSFMFHLIIYLFLKWKKNDKNKPWII